MLKGGRAPPAAEVASNGCATACCYLDVSPKRVIWLLNAGSRAVRPSSPVSISTTFCAGPNTGNLPRAPTGEKKIGPITGMLSACCCPSLQLTALNTLYSYAETTAKKILGAAVVVGIVVGA